jgi:hypothetical protein
MSPHLQEESLVDRETDSSALTLDTCSRHLLGMDGGASGCPLMGSPPSRSEGVSSRVLG